MNVAPTEFRLKGIRRVGLINRIDRATVKLRGKSRVKRHANVGETPKQRDRFFGKRLKSGKREDDFGRNEASVIRNGWA